MVQQETVRSRVWIWVVLLVVLAAVLVYVRSGHKKVPVRVAEVERQDIVSKVPTNGKVVPSLDFQAHAPTGGEIKELYVTLNQTVKKGDELVRLDDAQARKDVASAQAGLVAAKASLDAMVKGGTQDERNGAKSDLDIALLQQKQAQGSLDSLKKLQAEGAASPNEIGSAQQRLSEAQAKVNQLQTRRTSRYSAEDLGAQRASVAQAQAALDAARGGLAAVDVRAPFAGTVYAIPVSQYDYVQSGEALLDVADLTKLEVLAYFDEPEIGKLAIGQPVTIAWDAKPSLTWHGHIVEAPTTIITYGTRNVGECLISVDDARGDLLPNTNVTVSVNTLHLHNVLSVPREALHTEGSANFVYKVVNEHLQKTKVQVGVVTLTRVEITSGLASGDKIALGATTEEELSDGLPVREQY